MKASDIIELLEKKQETSLDRLYTLVKADGTAKRGMAYAVSTVNQSIDTAKTALIWIEEEIKIKG